MSDKLIRNARLILNTSLFYPNATAGGAISTVGSMDSRLGAADPSRLNCNYTIDWVTLLGDLYDQYTTFSLVVESVTYMSNGGVPFTSHITVTTSGLDWKEQTYDPVSKSIGGGCIIYMGPMNGTTQYPPQVGGFIFRKPTSRFGNLILTITNTFTGTQAGSFDRSVSLLYVIKIFGVDKNK